MNREKLEEMTGKELVAYADKLGVKVNANKERTGLKESKKTAVDKIIKYEEEHKQVEKKDTNKSAKSNKLELAHKCEEFLKNLNIVYKTRYYAGNKIKCFALLVGNNKVMEIYPQKSGYAVYVSKKIDCYGYDVISSNYFLNQRIDIVDDFSVILNLLERI